MLEENYWIVDNGEAKIGHNSRKDRVLEIEISKYATNKRW